jgi:hypothetical protein
VKDLISSLFLSRILPLVPYDTIIRFIQPYPTYPYPYRDLSLSLRRSLALSPSISRSLSRLSVDLSLCLHRSLALSPSISRSVSVDLSLSLRRSRSHILCVACRLDRCLPKRPLTPLPNVTDSLPNNNTPLLGTQKRVCLLKGTNLLCFFYGFFFFFFLNKGKYL